MSLFYESQVLGREKIKVEYQISLLSKLVRTLFPPTDFPLAVPSPPGVKIIRSNIIIHPLWSLTAVVTAFRRLYPPFSQATALSLPLPPAADH